jgi:hypothetical protein
LSGGGGGGVATTTALDPDEALRGAIVAAVYAGDTGRARALLDVLDAKPSLTPVSTLVAMRTRKAHNGPGTG